MEYFSLFLCKLLLLTTNLYKLATQQGNNTNCILLLERSENGVHVWQAMHTLPFSLGYAPFLASQVP